jgi:RNA polymerase sigma factor (sigma-70 family)
LQFRCGVWTPQRDRDDADPTAPHARSGTSIDASPKDLVSETMSPSPLRHPARMAGASLLRLQSDERLAQLAANGHEAAFDAIVDRYRTPLTRYCAGIVGASRAEDAVQQALINAHTALQRTDEVRHLRSWLYRITHNAALNVLRAVRDDVPLDAATDAAAVDEDGPAATFERTERFRATVDAVRELPERQRAALVLRELEGRSHEEIAETLGVTSGAARQHLMRARVALRGAVTAITPYPLVVRLAEMLTSPGAAGWTDVAVGAGAGATLAKLTAGVAATGALVGGAVGTERVVHHHGGAQDAAAATRSSGESAAKPRTATTRAVSLPAAGTVSSTGPSTSGPGGRGSAGSETERHEGESRGKGNTRDNDHGRDHDGPSDRSSGGSGRDPDGSSGPDSGGSGRNRGNDDARSGDGSGGRSGAAGGSGNEPDGSHDGGGRRERESSKHRNAGRDGEGRRSKSSGKGNGEHGGSSGSDRDSDSSTSARSHAGSADSSGSGPGRKSDSDHSAAPVIESSATVTMTTPSTNSGSESSSSGTGGSESGSSESGSSGTGGSGSGTSGRSGSDDPSDRSGSSG